MRSVLAVLTAFGLSAGAMQPASSDVVVELYTSQGCSSCPPADALLGELAERPDVIALSLHVDYWDYLGWKDAFANPAFSLRQRAYASFAGASMVYTPQMVIGGLDHIVGTKAMKLAEAISAHQAQAKEVDLQASRSGDVIRVEAAAFGGGAMVVQLVQYTPTQSVAIGRGENAGRDITYHNVVTSWSQIADWDGATPLSVEATASGADPLVVIVQQPGPGAILAAVKVK